MSKFSRVVVLVTALASLFAVMSSSAGAVTFTNTGGTTFHAAGGAVTLTPTRQPGMGSLLSCAGSTATGTVPSGAFTSLTGTLTYSPCSFSGNAFHIGCTYTLVPTGWTTGTQAITNGVTSLTCTMRISGTPICHIEGTTPVHYFNPDPPSTSGSLTLTASSSLTMTHSSGTTCSAWLGATTSGAVHMTHQKITLTGTPAGQPFIVSP